MRVKLCEGSEGVREQPVTENGFLRLRSFGTVGADCVQETYYIELISSKLPPAQRLPPAHFSGVSTVL